MYHEYMKTCKRCGDSKVFSEFNKSPKNKDGFHSYCRMCQKEHYRENKDRHCENVKHSKKEYLLKARTIMANALSGGCVDCGNLDIRVLDFDHLSDKLDNVPKMVNRGFSLDKVQEEISKCEVRCRNCHAIKTYDRLGGTWRDEFMP